MLRKVECFNHVNEHYAYHKLGVKTKFNYTVREHVIVTLLQNSIRLTLVYITLTSKLCKGKETLICIFCRMQITGRGRGFISLWELSLPRGKHVDQTSRRLTL